MVIMVRLQASHDTAILFVMLQRQGFGVYTWSNGDKYVGNWEMGRMHGHGLQITTPSIECRGMSRAMTPQSARTRRQRHANNHDHDQLQAMHLMGHDALIDNENEERVEMDTYYIGSWFDDIPHGDGITCYSCGHVYKGEFLDGQRDGYGSYMWPSTAVLNGVHAADSYRGYWREGAMNGLGFKRMVVGVAPQLFVDTYDGEFVNDMAHGLGTKVFGINGDSYTGFFHRDARSGHGIYK